MLRSAPQMSQMQPESLPDGCLLWKITGTPEIWNHHQPLVFDDLEMGLFACRLRKHFVK